MTSGVYHIQCLPTGKAYIGSSVNIEQRLACHKTKLRHGKHHSPHLQRAWAKYGESAFRFSVICECEPQHLIADEQDEMERYRACDGEFGFNIAPKAYSCRGVVRSLETRAKMSAVSRGRKFSAEHCKNISLNHARAWVGRRHTSETKSKMSIKASAWQTGRKLSPSHVANMAAACSGRRPKSYQGRNRSLSARDFYEICRDYLYEDGIVQLGKRFGVSKSTIFNIVNLGSVS